MQPSDDQTGSALPQPASLALITARTNRGLELRVAAEAIGVPFHVLRYAEEGGRPRLSSAKLIADFYGVRVTDIWPVQDKSAA